MNSADCNDPFAAARDAVGVLRCPFQGESIPMLLRHADVRAAAKDWQTYSSDAPFRVPIPSEEEWRLMRQLPIETDPPQHTEYRAMVEPFFRRAKDPVVMSAIERMIGALLDDAAQRESIEPEAIEHRAAGTLFLSDFHIFRVSGENLAVAFAEPARDAGEGLVLHRRRPRRDRTRCFSGTHAEVADRFLEGGRGHARAVPKAHRVRNAATQRAPTTTSRARAEANVTDKRLRETCDSRRK